MNNATLMKMQAMGMRGGTAPFIGTEIERTQRDYPYSYDPYIIQGRAIERSAADYMFWSDEVSEIQSLPISDRKNSSIVERILKTKVDCDVKLVSISMGANHSSGWEYFVYILQKVDK